MSTLSSVAALPLISTPSIAERMPNGYSRPDLAIRFDGFYVRWKQKLEKQRSENEACDAAEFAGREFKWSDPELEEWGALNAEREELVEAILVQPANSLADIVLQARACAMENIELWTNASSEEDAGARANKLLVERICDLAGVPVLPGIEVFVA
jgi:hypothetical protein